LGTSRENVVPPIRRKIQWDPGDDELPSSSRVRAPASLPRPSPTAPPVCFLRIRVPPSSAAAARTPRRRNSVRSRGRRRASYSFARRRHEEEREGRKGAGAAAARRREESAVSAPGRAKPSRLPPLLRDAQPTVAAPRRPKPSRQGAESAREETAPPLPAPLLQPCCALDDGEVVLPPCLRDLRRRWGPAP
jgi:hypothetical protein